MNDIFRKVDLAVLDPSHTVSDFDKAVKLAQRYHCATVCVPNEKLGEWSADMNSAFAGVKLSATVNFPNGYKALRALALEVVDTAFQVSELDIVLPVEIVKNKNLLAHYLEDIKKISSDKILKLILETGRLSSSEIYEASQVAAQAKIHFVKTCTGFGPRGVTEEDVKIIREAVLFSGTQIKASGGIKTIKEAKALVKCGATRLGIGLESFKRILQEEKIG